MSVHIVKWNLFKEKFNLSLLKVPLIEIRYTIIYKRPGTSNAVRVSERFD